MSARTESNGQIVRTPPANGSNGAAVTKAAAKDNTLAGFLESIKGEMARALPRHMTPDRMARVALTALRTTPHLAECTRESFAASIMACAALGLEPNTPLGQAYLIPRKNNRNGGRYECSLIIGYQGLLDLARRSGSVAGIQAFPVFEGDRFVVSYGLNPKLEHVPCDDQNREEPGRLTHVYAIVRLKDAGSEPLFTVLSRAQVEKRRNRGGSASGSFSPWQTDYVAMSLKTAIREVIKWAPRSAEMVRAETVELAHESGAAPFAALPEESARALLGAGIAEPEAEPQEITADGEVVDREQPAEG